MLESLNLRSQMDSIINSSRDLGLLYAESVREFKRRYIMHVIDAHHGNQSKAARELGMHRNTLSRTIAELDIDLSKLHPQRKPVGVHRIAAITEAERRA